MRLGGHSGHLSALANNALVPGFIACNNNVLTCHFGLYPRVAPALHVAARCRGGVRAVYIICWAGALGVECEAVAPDQRLPCCLCCWPPTAGSVPVPLLPLVGGAD